MANADGSLLKRSFIDALGQEPFIDFSFLGRNGTRKPSVGANDCRTQPVASPAKRRSISYSGPYAMPCETSPIIQPTFPSFMAVFGGEAADVQEDAREGVSSKQAQHGIYTSLMTTETQPYTHYFTHSKLQHRDSINSLTSSSTNSSPTTTISTFDSPLITDLSPSSSPESPPSALPLSPFKAMMRSPEEASKQNGGQNNPAVLAGLASQTLSEQQSNGGRNVKNLSLNMTVATPARPATSAGLESFHPLSAPTSPLREPLRTGRRKPVGLTIQTPGFDQLAFTRTVPEIPPTPSQRPILQHIQSSPMLPSMMSPSIGPAGGMQLSLPPFSQSHSRPGSQSSFASQSATSSLSDVREEDQPQRSQETQERGYPSGPVQVYDSGIYLYLEPTVEEAGRFDTVINVAREIKNPFEGLQTGSNTVMSVWRNNEDRSSIPEPQTAISEISFKSAFEWPQSTDVTTPTTPRPTSSTSAKEPEYIHVPWDHNSEIINDLFPLCRLIDERVSAGKTVLIHCQLGVSRSASLVIAYGLYKGYQPTFPTMYDAVKARSRWVGPNMSLIYQLGDFRSQIDRNMQLPRTREAPVHWFKDKRRETENAITPTSAAPRLEAVMDPTPASTSSQIEVSTVPEVLWSLRLNKKLPPVPLFKQQSSQDKFQTGELLQPIAYQPPTSTPKTSPSQSSTSPTIPSPQSANQVVSRPLPLRELMSQTPEIPAHRPRKQAPAGLTFSQPSPLMDLAMRDVPMTPSLFSPRATEFMASPFGVTSAGDLLVGSGLSVPAVEIDAGQPSPAEVDPRSPHQRDDTGEILRHIDDIL